jgi:hypothetical protein
MKRSPTGSGKRALLSLRGYRLDIFRQSSQRNVRKWRQ